MHDLVFNRDWVESPTRLAANRIAQIIQKDHLETISTREIQPRGLISLMSSREIAPAFRILEDAYWLTLLPTNYPIGQLVQLIRAFEGRS